MRLPLTVEVKGLDLKLECEVEIPDGLLRPDSPAELLDDAQLRQRWRCSARTLARLRNRGQLPYSQPTPRRYLYALSDIEVVEKAANGSGLRAVPRRARGGSAS